MTCFCIVSISRHITLGWVAWRTGWEVAKLHKLDIQGQPVLPCRLLEVCKELSKHLRGINIQALQNNGVCT